MLTEFPVPCSPGRYRVPAKAADLRTAHARISALATLQIRFGRALQRRRKKADYPREAFANIVGVHRTYTGTIEKARKTISLSNIERITSGLGMCPGELLSGAHPEVSPIGAQGFSPVAGNPTLQLQLHLRRYISS